MSKKSKGDLFLIMLGIFILLLVADIVMHIVYISKLSGFKNSLDLQTVAVTAQIEPSDEEGTALDTPSEEDTAEPTPTPGPYDNLGKKVFMGNSIITAVTEYGYLENEKFISKVGININTITTNQTFMTTEGQVDGLTALKAEDADSVFIMLGGNEVEWMSIDTMITKYKAFFESIREINPDMKIFIYSITPMEPSYLSKHSDITNEKIVEWNDRLKEMAEEEGVGFIDLDPVFKADDGTLIDDYAEPDGMHWNSRGCKAFEEFMISEGIVEDDAEE